MTTSRSSLERMIGQARAAVDEAMRAACVVRAWEALQERDAEGNPRGPLPYTPRALAEFTAAHEKDPEDIGIVHDLAICHHARAWDLELQGSSSAAAEWGRALGCWHVLASSAEFWSGLKAQLHACDPEADSSLLDDLRRDLLEQLLDIHVDFIRHYCELANMDRAVEHVEIVKRARIRRAVRKRLVDKVFQAMTASVPESRAQQAYDSALTVVERFLTLFPATISALRLHAELCQEWAAGLSFQDDWQQILDLGSRAEPLARCLSEHRELSERPLARTALAELADKLALLAHDRANSCVPGGDFSVLSVAERDALKVVGLFGETWCRLGVPHGPANSVASQALPYCLWITAQCLIVELQEIERSEVDLDTKVTAGIRNCREALSRLEEAAKCNPDEEAFEKQAASVREHLEHLEDVRLRLDLGADPGDDQ